MKKLFASLFNGEAGFWGLALTSLMTTIVVITVIFYIGVATGVVPHEFADVSTIGGLWFMVFMAWCFIFGLGTMLQ